MSGLLDDLKIKDEKKPAKSERGQEYGVHLDCDDKKRVVTAGTKSSYVIKVKNTGSKDETFTLKTDIIHGKNEDSPEWPVTLQVAGAQKKPKKGEDKKEQDKKEKTITIGAGETGEVTLIVEAPRGAIYGDRADVVFSVVSMQDAAVTESMNFTTTAKQAILAVKTAIGHEKTVADALFSKAKTKASGIFSILSPGPIRGYVFVESMNIDRLRDIVRGIPRAHGIVEGETNFKDVEHFLTPKPVVAGIQEGAIVELIAGPFKGERAMVKSIDESKEEITVELIEAMVAIPVTVRGDHVRVLQKD